MAEIEYCVPCSLLPQAVAVAQELLQKDGDRLDAVRLKTGSGGVFKVRLGDDLVWDGDVADLEVEDRVEALLQT